MQYLSASKGLTSSLGREDQKSNLFNRFLSPQQARKKSRNVRNSSTEFLMKSSFTFFPFGGVHGCFNMDQMPRLRVKPYYIQFTLVATSRSFPDKHISSNEIALVLVPFCRQFFQEIRRHGLLILLT